MDAAVDAIPKAQKILFLTYSSLFRLLPKIHAIVLQAKPFEVHILTSRTHRQLVLEARDLNLEWSVDSEFVDPYFIKMESIIYDWLDNPAALVKIQYEPLLFAHLTRDFFIIPSCYQVSSFNYQPDQSMEQLMHSLNSLLTMLNHKDELFVLGESSKIIAKGIVSQATMRAPRRSSSTNLAVVLVDRCLDLKTIARHKPTLLDMIYEILGKPTLETDVFVSPSNLFSQSNIEGMYLSIAHGADKEALDFLHVLGSLDYQEALPVVRKRLIDIIHAEIHGAEIPKVI